MVVGCRQLTMLGGGGYSGVAMGSSLGSMSGGIGGLDNSAFMQQGRTPTPGYGNGQSVGTNGVNSLTGGPTNGNAANGLYRGSADLLGNGLLRSSSDGALQYDNSNFPVLSGLYRSYSCCYFSLPSYPFPFPTYLFTFR